MEQFINWARDNEITIESVFAGYHSKDKRPLAAENRNWKHYAWRVEVKVADSDAWQVPHYATGEGHREVFHEDESLRAQRAVKAANKKAEESGATVHGLYALKQTVAKPVPGKPGRARPIPSWVVPNPPTLEDVLCALQSDARCGECMLFEDFCDELGFDQDSRQAEKVWRACQETRGHLQRLFGSLFDSFMELEE